MPAVYLKFQGGNFSCLMHLLQYVYGRRMERESGLFPRLTPIQTLLTDSFPRNGNLRRLHPRLRAAASASQPTFSSSLIPWHHRSPTMSMSCIKRIFLTSPTTQVPPSMACCYIVRTASAHTASGAMSISPGHESVPCAASTFSKNARSRNGS